MKNTDLRALNSYSLFFVTASLSFFCEAAFASDCRINLLLDGKAFSKINLLVQPENGDAKIILESIVREKGYDVTEDLDAPFKMSAASSVGPARTQKLSFTQTLITQVSSEVSFGEGSGKASKRLIQKNGIGPGSEDRAIRRTLRMVERMIPKCST